MTVLIIVDVQNDFVPGGALAVPGGDRIVPVINSIQAEYDLAVATQDWHPAEHGSFAVNHAGRRPGDLIDLDGLAQVLWPIHCVQGTYGAELVASLDTRPIHAIFRKGTDRKIDSYSALFDNGHRRRTGLSDYLRGMGVTDVDVCGLATDYCVKFTALDAVTEGFSVRLLVHASTGIELHPGDVAAAIGEMSVAGVKIVEA